MCRLVAKLLPGPMVVVEGPVRAARREEFRVESEAVARATERRRMEFAAGRAFAQQGLAELGFEPAPLLVRNDGVPQWPKGVVGSITHCADYCAVAVARDHDVRAVGIDVEGKFRVTPELMTRILSDAEMNRHVRGRDENARRFIATLIFSAKEAFYKCQYGVSGARLGFHDVEVLLDEESKIFHAELRKLAGPLGKGSVFRGAFATDATLLATAVIFRPE